MPHRRRYDTINEYHLHRIERQALLLRIALADADLRLTPFRPHSDAIAVLRGDLAKAINLLNDRPADYEEPHHAPFSQG
ncbi:MAG: hypothetical protein AB7P20_19220 [Rhizobiaceae bacterium]